MCIFLSTKNIEMVIYSQYYLLFVKFLENISLFQEIYILISVSRNTQ